MRKIFPAVWFGLIPTPLFVIIALVSGVTLNCSAMNLIAALNGASSGTSILINKNKKLYMLIYTLKGNFGSLAKVILNLTRFFDIFNR